jgi:RNA polymerase sigma factor (sigma-70 family)
LENKEHVNALVDHLFRHEAGKMLAVLTRVFGFKNIEQAEDIVNDTMLKALETWKFGKIPENPAAWLHRAAKNRAIDLLRRQQLKYKVDSDIAYLLRSEYTLAPALNEMFTENEIKDSQLRMMFASCDPSFSNESQITLILKTLGGLSTKEIAKVFLSNEETITKRLFRIKEKIREENLNLDYPGSAAMPQRIDAVLKAIYLIFNEGYNSSHPETLIREDLCEEAMRLCILLTENEKTNLPQTHALLALMCFQVSRFNARLDDRGMIILLKDQDREKWNKFLIGKGNEHLFYSSAGNEMHDYHLEAAIASLHSNAASYASTDWKKILDMYTVLLGRTANPLVAMSRCVVMAEVEGYEKAIAELLKIKGLEENCYYQSTLGEFYFKSGNSVMAKTHLEKALALTHSKAEQELVKNKIDQIT